MYIKYFVIALIIFLFGLVILPKSVSAMTATLSIPEKFSDVKPGDKVYFETEVKWPENNGRKDLRIEYSIKNKEGTEVSYLKVLKAIETQASFMDSMPIPASAAQGMYKIDMKINDYADLNQSAAASFNVTKGDTATQTYLFIIIGALNVIIFFLIFEMFFWGKEKSLEAYAKILL